jgi:hypothetical protein
LADNETAAYTLIELVIDLAKLHLPFKLGDLFESNKMIRVVYHCGFSSFVDKTLVKSRAVEDESQCIRENVCVVFDRVALNLEKG